MIVESLYTLFEHYTLYVDRHTRLCNTLNCIYYVWMIKNQHCNSWKEKAECSEWSTIFKWTHSHTFTSKKAKGAFLARLNANKFF